MGTARTSPYQMLKYGHNQDLMLASLEETALQRMQVEERLTSDGLRGYQ